MAEVSVPRKCELVESGMLDSRGDVVPLQLLSRGGQVSG